MKTNGDHFAALPVNTCADNLTVGQLAEHEYFGSDFMDRKNSVCVARGENGKLHAVWTYGSWDVWAETEIKPRMGSMVLVHTQTGRKTYLEYVDHFMFGTPEFMAAVKQFAGAKMKQWTLK